MTDFLPNKIKVRVLVNKGQQMSKSKQFAELFNTA